VDDVADDTDDDKKAVDPDDIKLDRLVQQGSRKKAAATTAKGKAGAKGKK
jgi:hypothetical protein